MPLFYNFLSLEHTTTNAVFAKSQVPWGGNAHDDGVGGYCDGQCIYIESNIKFCKFLIHCNQCCYQFVLITMACNKMFHATTATLLHNNRWDYRDCHLHYLLMKNDAL